MEAKNSLLKFALDKEDYTLAAKCIVYGVLKATCDRIEAEQRRRNGTSKSTGSREKSR